MQSCVSLGIDLHEFERRDRFSGISQLPFEYNYYGRTYLCLYILHHFQQAPEFVAAVTSIPAAVSRDQTEINQVTAFLASLLCTSNGVRQANYKLPY